MRPRYYSPGPFLAPREVEVLRLVAQGYSNQGIADRMFISRKAVENYLNRIMDKVEVPRERRWDRRVLLALGYTLGAYGLLNL